jgi:hypothetical protein
MAPFAPLRVTIFLTRPTSYRVIPLSRASRLFRTP